MKISPSPLKNGIISGVAFFGTVAILSLVYANIIVNNAGTIAGTNAPYIQLTPCQAN